MGNDAKFLQAVKHRLLSRRDDAVGDLAWVASEASLSGNFEKKPVDMITTEAMAGRQAAGVLSDSTPEDAWLSGPRRDSSSGITAKPIVSAGSDPA